MIQCLEPAVGFATLPLPEGGGYFFSLPSLLGEFLYQLEESYGPRDMSFTLLGVEFCGDRPQIWYPGDRKHVIIQLSDDARLDYRRAIFQLSHEAVHLLAPIGRRDVVVAEEGLATYFSHEVSQREQLHYANDLASYRYCESKLLEWLALAPDGIKATRALKPQMSDWTPKLLRQATPAMSKALASQLCEKFAKVEERLGSPPTTIVA